jgi:hypothetical protein
MCRSQTGAARFSSRTSITAALRSSARGAGSDDYGVGVAIEVGKDEAYAPLRFLQLAFGAVSAHS